MRWWRIGSESNVLYFLTQIEIPSPTTWVYKDFSVVEPQSLGGEGKHGFANITLTWQNLSKISMSRIWGYALTSTVYLTIDANLPTAPGSHWIDVSGRPGIPTFTGEGFFVYTDVTWFINNLITINDPSELYELGT